MLSRLRSSSSLVLFLPGIIHRLARRGGSLVDDETQLIKLNPHDTLPTYLVRTTYRTSYTAFSENAYKKYERFELGKEARDFLFYFSKKTK